jgi:hypothetical protein
LHTDFERRRAGALVLNLELGLVVSCGGAGGSGRRNINVDGPGFDAASGVDVAAVVFVAVVGEDGVVGVEGAAGVEGVEVAGSGDEAGNVDVALAVVVIIGVVVKTRGWWGVSDFGGAGSSMVEVEGMRYLLKGRE